MNASASAPLVAVDIGNSRIKLGLFTAASANEPGLPKPTSTLDILPQPPGKVASAGYAGPDPLEAIPGWLAGHGLAVEHCAWRIGSVQRTVSSRVVEWLREQGASDLALLASRDLPLTVALPRPDMVGIDRLLGALAANRLRPAARPAVIVDLGTAITVDLVSLAGAFLGGAIMPGIGLSARALHEFTDLLPLLEMQALAEPPPALGANTVEAMTSGIYWGAVGGVRQLIELLARAHDAEPLVFLTGGAAPAVAPLLARDARYEPFLVLAGIALATQTPAT